MKKTTKKDVKPGVNTSAFVAEWLLETTKKNIFIIAANKNLEVNTDKISELFNDTYIDRYNSLLEETSENGKQADFFSQLENNTISPVVQEVGKLTLIEGCVKYAEFLLLNTQTK